MTSPLFFDSAPVTFPADLKSRFSTDGFVALTGFLSADEVALVRRNLQRYIAEVVPAMPVAEVFYEDKADLTSLKQIQRLFQWDEFFARLFLQSRFFALAEHLLERPVLGKNMQYFNKPPGIGLPTPAHQDGHYWKITPMEGLTMWLALDEVDEENGCVRYIPGSHRAGLRPHGKTGTLGFSQGITDYGAADTAREVCMVAQPGDLLVHAAEAIHRADGNRSATRTRQALGFIYYAARVREDLGSIRDYQANLIRDLTATGKV